MKINQLLVNLFFIFFMGNLFALQAQKEENFLIYPKEVKDSTVTYLDDWDSPDKLLQIVLNNEFSRLITGNTLAGIGNYASVNTANSTLDAAINIVKNNKVYTFKIEAGLSDNVANIFSNSKLGSNVGLGVTYHRIFYKPGIALKVSDVTSINNETRKIAETHQKKYLEIINFKVNTQAIILKKQKEHDKLVKKKQLLDNLSPRKKTLFGTITKLKSRKKLLIDSIQKVKDSVNKIKNLRRRNPTEMRIDQQNLTFLFEELGNMVDELKTTKEEIKDNDDKWKNLLEEENQKDHLTKLYSIQIKTSSDEILKLKDKVSSYDEDDEIETSISKTIFDFSKNLKKINDIKALDISVEWFSIGAEVNYQTFNLFDDTRDFENQIFQENDLVPSFFISLSGYTNRPLIPNNKKKSTRKSDLDTGVKHIKYYSLGFKGTYGNNLSSLNLTEVKTTTEVTSNRDLIKRLNAYVGNFEEEELSGQFFGDFYQFMGNKNNVGVHVKGALDVGSFRPILSTRVGVLIPFVDSKNIKSSVNLEVFFGLNDLFNKASDKSLFGRNVFGIQASLPLNFKLI